MNAKTDALGYYAVLGVDIGASAEEIKRSYYEKARYWHPDHNKNPNAVEMFQKVSVAYDVLKEDNARLRYDLLSAVYKSSNFPTMGSLKIYKNRSGKDDSNLRVLHQQSVSHGIIRQRKDICNFREAQAMSLSISLHNWLSGWWGRNGIKNTISALCYNLHKSEADDEDNLQLMVHNALAYEQENNPEMAWTYAKKAELTAKNDSFLQNKLREFIASLPFKLSKKVKIDSWNPVELKIRQLMFPIVLVLIIVLVVLAGMRVFAEAEKPKNNYYIVRNINGVLVPSDMIENKIMKIDSSIDDSRYLAHIKNEGTVYYGPDERYSPLARLQVGKTVRITGYTYDRSWYQIILDDGQKGYVSSTNIEMGIGTAVPARSKVYRGK